MICDSKAYAFVTFSTFCPYFDLKLFPLKEVLVPRILVASAAIVEAEDAEFIENKRTKPINLLINRTD